MRYELVYTEQRKIVWVLILIPLTLSALFISILLSIHHIPDWAIIVSSVLLVTISTLAVLFIIKNWMSIKTTITVTDDYFQYTMQKRSPIYRHKELRVSWEKISNFSADAVNASAFAVFRLSNPTIRFSLSPASAKSIDVMVFGDFVADVEQKIKAYNEKATEKHLHLITHKSIFESTGARIGAIAFLIFLVFITIAYTINYPSSESLNWWRLGWLWLASIPYLIAVLGSMKKKESSPH